MARKADLSKLPGDPVKGAEVLCELVQLPDPPLHFIVGQDALYLVKQKLDGLKKDLERFSELSNRINRDDL